MKIYHIKFKVDTGYEYEKRLVILSANNEEEANAKFHAWIKPRLKGERMLLEDTVKILEIDPDEFSIIYQNYI